MKSDRFVLSPVNGVRFLMPEKYDVRQVITESNEKLGLYAPSLSPSSRRAKEMLPVDGAFREEENDNRNRTYLRVSNC